MNQAHPTERDGPEHRPKLSLVVVAYDIARELPRTLYTLSALYQRDIVEKDFEVIVVDNGSPQAVDPTIWQDWRGQFRLLRVSRPSPSPANAANQGIAAARADHVGVMIDGARMCSPGLLSQAWRACQTNDHAVVGALGWYLGYDYQRQSMLVGYGPEQEDALLARTDWQQDGYSLFSISAMDESSTDGWHAPVAEFNAIFMHRERWDDLQGFDTRFDMPGGGLVNLDLCKRALEAPQAQAIVLLGEATFHQQHGGVATNTPLDQALRDWTRWSEQYETIRGKPYDLPHTQRSIQYWGSLPPSMRLHYLRALAFPSQAAAREAHPMGSAFNVQHWAMPSHVWREADLTPQQTAIRELLAQALTQERYSELAAACRHLRRDMPEWGAPQHLLSLVCAWSPHGEAPPPKDGESGDLLETLTTLLCAGAEASHPTAQANAAQAELQHLRAEMALAQSREALWHTSVHQLTHELSLAQSELQTTYASLSWRLTAGLRAVHTWIQKARRPR